MLNATEMFQQDRGWLSPKGSMGKETVVLCLKLITEMPCFPLLYDSDRPLYIVYFPSQETDKSALSHMLSM